MNLLNACGRVRAAPMARASDVVGDFILTIRPEDRVQIRPIAAIYWGQAVALSLDYPTPPSVQDFYDMRQTRWERQQRVRQIPVIQEGQVIDMVVTSWHTLSSRFR